MAVKKQPAANKTLIIVESPTKARTISGFLDKSFKVESSYGHIRDLPKSKIGIDIENNFEPQYIIPTKNKKRVNDLKKEALSASRIILATDEDREGEAIAWHLSEVLGLKDKSALERIAFHEITKSAIESALNHPRGLYMSLVDAQQARRSLDRLVGYKLSPFLWKKVMGGLSAGRVQSVAVRLIVEREDAVRRFIPETYFTIEAKLTPDNDANIFEASLSKINNKALGKLGLKDEDEAKLIVSNIKSSSLKVLKIESRETKRMPNPPFTTSTLQQEASKRLHFSSKQTMSIAQGLYENGLITYMRTDSLNLSSESLSGAKAWLTDNLGKEFASESPRVFKTKSKSAQEAHEAIRPTNPGHAPENFGGEEKEQKLYDLIWRRFMASQMPAAIFKSSKITVLSENKDNNYELAATGSHLIKEGFLKIWPSAFEDNLLPKLKENSLIKLISINHTKHQTEPPARYNEASLIKALEEYGIGRPSTYAPTISVIQERGYVLKDEARRFVPSEIGETVTRLLIEHFPEIVDINFTASMEDKLDKIADGKEDWRKVIKEFYDPFAVHLAEKYEVVETRKNEEPSDEICDKCGKPMVIKNGRFGKFLACSGYPACKNTKKIAAEGLKNELGEEIICPKCGIGKVVRKRSKKGRFFFGCTRYPDCDYATWQNPTIKNKKDEDAIETEKEDTE